MKIKLSKLIWPFSIVIPILNKRELFFQIFALGWLIIFLFTLVVTLICTLEPGLNALPNVVNTLTYVNLKDNALIVATIILKLLLNLENNEGYIFTPFVLNE